MTSAGECSSLSELMYNAETLKFKLEEQSLNCIKLPSASVVLSLGQMTRRLDKYLSDSKLTNTENTKSTGLSLIAKNGKGLDLSSIESDIEQCPMKDWDPFPSAGMSFSSDGSVFSISDAVSRSDLVSFRTLNASCKKNVPCNLDRCL